MNYLNNKPLISVIIPTYNHARFIGKCLQSVIDQTYTNWEAIVVNNFSEDNTEKIVKDFNDNRINLINFKNNGVIAASRNEGIRNSKGEYLAFLDSDDLWFRDKLSVCLDQIVENDLICHGLKYQSNGKDLKDVFFHFEEQISYYKLLYNESCLATSAVMVKKSLVDGVDGFCKDVNLVTVEDYDLWLRLLQQGAKFKFIKNILGIYTLHEGNSSSSQKSIIKHFNARLFVLNKHFKMMDKIGFIERLMMKRRFAIATYGTGRQFYKNGLYLNSIKYYLLSLLKFPFFIKAYIATFMSFFQIVKYSVTVTRKLKRSNSSI